MDVSGDSQFFYDVRLTGPNGESFKEHITQRYDEYFEKTDFIQVLQANDGNYNKLNTNIYYEFPTQPGFPISLYIWNFGNA